MGGRIDDLAVFERQPSTVYAGAATGGLWKTVNNGTTWEPVFDHEESASIGAAAIAQDNANIVWAGTGESNNRQSSSWGTGVYKSTDAGRTWKNMGLTDSKHIGRIVIDPSNHDVVYIAAAGHLWGPNKERGVFKTVDGGLTWIQCLFVDEQTGASDIIMDPSNNKVLYTAMYQRQRSAWGFNGGGPGSGIYKTIDGGETWTKLTEGIPAGPLGRIGLDIYRKDPKTVIALIQSERQSGLYRSNDAGEHWSRVSGTDPRPLYFSQVRVDPNDLRRVYVLGTRVMVSNDSGRNFSEVHLKYTRPAGDRPRDDMDVHAMWIDPHDSNHIIIGADVGVAVSYDRGVTWDYMDNMPLGQFYHAGFDMDMPYHVYGGLQDNDVWTGPSAVRNRFGMTNADWTTLSIGDGFVAVADPMDSHNIYGETQDGNIVRVNRDTNERKSIRPQAGHNEPPLRWAWDTPLTISPHDPNTILTAANKVFRSSDRGDTWQAISPDLTSGADRENLSLMGVVGKELRLSQNDGVAAWPAIVALTESSKKAGIYYAGADDGTVHVSKDGGRTWANISAKFPGRPAGAAGVRFAASAFNEGVAYAVFNNHRADDYNPYVYASSDYGETWVSLSSTLPAKHALNCITEDPKNPDVLYLGSESGLFVTLDRGKHWTSLQNNLPVVPIDEIAVHPRDNDLILATHGRSIWILDDIAPIQHAVEATEGTSYLFEIRPSIEFNTSNERASYQGDRRFWGQNPEFGAGISYYMVEAPKEIRIEIRDGVGDVVRELSGENLKNGRAAGLNRAYWDLRHSPVAASTGPFVLPGDYQVTMLVDGHDAGTRTVQVTGDPAVKISDADRKLQHDTAVDLHRLQSTSLEAATTVTMASGELHDLREAAKRAESLPASFASSADDLASRLSRLNIEFGIGRIPAGTPGAPSIGTQITNLKNQIMGWTAAPTTTQLALAKDARSELGKLVDELNDITGTAIPALFKLLSDTNARPAEVKPIPKVKLAP